jgi:hypothetical protein
LEPGVEIEFELVRADYEAFGHELGRRDQRYLDLARRYRAISLKNQAATGILIPFVLLGFAFIFGLGRDQIPAALMVGVVLWPAGVAYATRQRPYIERIRKSVVEQASRGWFDDCLGIQRVTVGPEGIRWIDQYRNTHITWLGVRRVIDTHEHIFLILADSNTIVLPKRGFGSSDDAVHFLQETLKLRDAAGAAGDPALRDFLAARDTPCPSCGYNLKGARGNSCPECGLWLNVHSFKTTSIRDSG